MRDAVQTTLCVIVAFFLALRVIAQPVVLSSPEPGVMALCAGGQIVYVSLKVDAETDPAKERLADPCPFFGVTAVTTPGLAPDGVRPEGYSRSETELRALNIATKSVAHGPGQRAPPGIV